MELCYRGDNKWSIKQNSKNIFLRYIKIIKLALDNL